MVPMASCKLGQNWDVNLGSQSLNLGSRFRIVLVNPGSLRTQTRPWHSKKPLSWTPNWLASSFYERGDLALAPHQHSAPPESALTIKVSLLGFSTRFHQPLP